MTSKQPSQSTVRSNSLRINAYKSMSLMQDRRSRWTVPKPKVCRTRSGRPSPLLGVPSTRPKPQFPATRWRATVAANLYPSKRQTIHSSAVLPRAAHRCTSMAAAPPDGAWHHGVFVSNALRKSNLKCSPSLSHDRHRPTPLHNTPTPGLWSSIHSGTGARTASVGVIGYRISCREPPKHVRYALYAAATLGAATTTAQACTGRQQQA